MIRVVALDIYGTVLASDDPDNAAPPRKGTGNFFDRADRLGIPIVSTSDGPIEVVRAELTEVFEKHPSERMSVQRFADIFQLNSRPKNFQHVIDAFGLLPHHLLVVGDTLEMDIEGAQRVGAHYVHVPRYTIFGNVFDLNSIVFP